MNKEINSYLGVLIITIFASGATMIILHTVYENSFYEMIGYSVTDTIVTPL